MTKFITDCIIIINREEENGTLNGRIGEDIVELMGKACDHLFHREPELLREVHEAMEPVIKLLREELEEQIEKQKEELAQKNIQLKQKDKQQKAQLEQHIQNCIQQCKTEGKDKAQTEQTLQQIFDLTTKNAKEKLEKYW